MLHTAGLPAATASAPFRYDSSTFARSGYMDFSLRIALTFFWGAMGIPRVLGHPQNDGSRGKWPTFSRLELKCYF